VREKSGGTGEREKGERVVAAKRNEGGRGGGEATERKESGV
jgi:hypothetical protein